MFIETDDIDNIEIIKWAFEQGYHLGNMDTKEGVHIDFSETQKYFLSELSKFYAKNSSLESVGA